MKKHILRTPQMLAAAIAVGLKRFQIYRENINGTRILVQVINSETEAVEAWASREVAAFIAHFESRTIDSKAVTSNLKTTIVFFGGIKPMARRLLVMYPRCE